VKQGLLKKHNTQARATALFCAVEGAIPYVAMAKIFTVKKVVARLKKVLMDEVVQKN
jgi:hypothetical protein